MTDWPPIDIHPADPQPLDLCGTGTCSECGGATDSTATCPSCGVSL